jgi:peptidoglycan/LPS O-acetylase OafA/YrhL
MLLVARTIIVYADLPRQPKITHWRTDALIVGLVLAKLDQSPDFRARLVAHRGTLATTAVLALVFAGWVDLAHNDYFQLPVAIAFGLLVALAIANVPALEVPGRTGVVSWIARISYSMYLVHPLILDQLIRRDLPARFGPLLGWSLVGAIGLAATLAASQLLYLLVERPGLALRDWLRTRARRRAGFGAVAT